MDRGAWQATTHGFTKSGTRLCVILHTHTYIQIHIHCHSTCGVIHCKKKKKATRKQLFWQDLLCNNKNKKSIKCLLHKGVHEKLDFSMKIYHIQTFRDRHGTKMSFMFHLIMNLKERWSVEVFCWTRLLQFMTSFLFSRYLKVKTSTQAVIETAKIYWSLLMF